jgi:hypothetical protein
MEGEPLMNDRATLTPEVPVIPNEVQELAGKAAGALAVSRDFKVTTVEQYNAAGDHLKLVKALQGTLDAQHRVLKAPILESGRRIDAFFKEPRDRAADAERVLKSAMLGYTRERELVRQQQEAAAQTVARKQQERLIASAEKLEAKGKVEQAEAKREQAVMIPTPVIAVETPKIAGVSMRETWSFEVVDESLIPREYLVRDDTKIRAVVRALKSATNIPGIKAFPEQGISSRRA